MSNIRSKLINAKNMGMATLSGAAALGVGYYNSFNNNKLSHTAKDIADKVDHIIPDSSLNAVNITTLAADAHSLGNELYKASRIQGITLDVVLCVIALPSFLESLGHHAAKNGFSWAQYVAKNWDYIIGRGFQMGGFAVMGKGIHEDGAGNPQYATGYVGAAPLAISVGTFFVEKNRAKNIAEAAAQQQGYLPFNSAQVNANAPIQQIEEGMSQQQYQPPGYGNSAR
jgi:hypothetical protein